MTTTTKAPPTIVATFNHKHRPWWIGVSCGWCNLTAYPSLGCMVCGRFVERVQALANSEAWKKWKAVLKDDPDAHLVVGDWLEENGFLDLAEEARRAWTHEAKCTRCEGIGTYTVQRHQGRSFAFEEQICPTCAGTGKMVIVETVSREVPQ